MAEKQIDINLDNSKREYNRRMGYSYFQVDDSDKIELLDKIVDGLLLDPTALNMFKGYIPFATGVTSTDWLTEYWNYFKNDPEAYQSAAHGMLTGLLLPAIYKGGGWLKDKSMKAYLKDKYQTEDEKLDEFIDKINKFGALGLFTSNTNIHTEHAINMNEIGKQMQIALEDQNKFAFDNFNTEMIFEMVALGKATGNMLMVTDLLKEWGDNITEDQFKELFPGVEYSETNINNYKTFMQNTVSEAKKASENIDLMEAFDNPFKLKEPRQGETLTKEEELNNKKYHLFNTYKRELARIMTFTDSMQKRTLDLLDGFKTTLGESNTSLIEKISKMTSFSGVENLEQSITADLEELHVRYNTLLQSQEMLNEYKGELTKSGSTPNNSETKRQLVELDKLIKNKTKQLATIKYTKDTLSEISKVDQEVINQESVGFIDINFISIKENTDSQMNNALLELFLEEEQLKGNPISIDENGGIRLHNPKEISKRLSEYVNEMYKVQRYSRLLIDDYANLKTKKGMDQYFDSLLKLHEEYEKLEGNSLSALEDAEISKRFKNLLDIIKKNGYKNTTQTIIKDGISYVVKLNENDDPEFYKIKYTNNDNFELGKQKYYSEIIDGELKYFRTAITDIENTDAKEITEVEFQNSLYGNRITNEEYMKVFAEHTEAEFSNFEKEGNVNGFVFEVAFSDIHSEAKETTVKSKDYRGNDIELETTDPGSEFIKTVQDINYYDKDNNSDIKARQVKEANAKKEDKSFKNPLLQAYNKKKEKFKKLVKLLGLIHKPFDKDGNIKKSVAEISKNRIYVSDKDIANTLLDPTKIISIDSVDSKGNTLTLYYQEFKTEEDAKKAYSELNKKQEDLLKLYDKINSEKYELSEELSKNSNLARLTVVQVGDTYALFTDEGNVVELNGQSSFTSKKELLLAVTNNFTITAIGKSEQFNKHKDVLNTTLIMKNFEKKPNGKGVSKLTDFINAQEIQKTKTINGIIKQLEDENKITITSDESKKELKNIINSFLDKYLVLTQRLDYLRRNKDSIASAVRPEDNTGLNQSNQLRIVEIQKLEQEIQNEIDKLNEQLNQIEGATEAIVSTALKYSRYSNRKALTQQLFNMWKALDNLKDYDAKVVKAQIKQKLKDLSDLNKISLIEDLFRDYNEEDLVMLIDELEKDPLFKDKLNILELLRNPDQISTTLSTAQENKLLDSLSKFLVKDLFNRNNAKEIGLSSMSEIDLANQKIENNNKLAKGIVHKKKRNEKNKKRSISKNIDNSALEEVANKSPYKDIADINDSGIIGTYEMMEENPDSVIFNEDSLEFLLEILERIEKFDNAIGTSVLGLKSTVLENELVSQDAEIYQDNIDPSTKTRIDAFDQESYKEELESKNTKEGDSLPNNPYQTTGLDVIEGGDPEIEINKDGVPVIKKPAVYNESLSHYYTFLDKYGHTLARANKKANGSKLLYLTYSKVKNDPAYTEIKEHFDNQNKEYYDNLNEEQRKEFEENVIFTVITDKQGSPIKYKGKYLITTIATAESRLRDHSEGTYWFNGLTNQAALKLLKDYYAVIQNDNSVAISIISMAVKIYENNLASGITKFDDYSPDEIKFLNENADLIKPVVRNIYNTYLQNTREKINLEPAPLFAEIDHVTRGVSYRAKKQDGRLASIASVLGYANTKEGLKEMRENYNLAVVEIENGKSFIYTRDPKDSTKKSKLYVEGFRPGTLLIYGTKEHNESVLIPVYTSDFSYNEGIKDTVGALMYLMATADQNDGIPIKDSVNIRTKSGVKITESFSIFPSFKKNGRLSILNNFINWGGNQIRYDGTKGKRGIAVDFKSNVLYFSNDKGVKYELPRTVIAEASVLFLQSAFPNLREFKTALATMELSAEANLHKEALLEYIGFMMSNRVNVLTDNLMHNNTFIIPQASVDDSGKVTMKYQEYVNQFTWLTSAFRGLDTSIVPIQTGEDVRLAHQQSIIPLSEEGQGVVFNTGELKESIEFEENEENDRGLNAEAKYKKYGKQSNGKKTIKNNNGKNINSSKKKTAKKRDPNDLSIIDLGHPLANLNSSWYAEDVEAERNYSTVLNGDSFDIFSNSIVQHSTTKAPIGKIPVGTPMIMGSKVNLNSKSNNIITNDKLYEYLIKLVKAFESEKLNPIEKGFNVTTTFPGFLEQFKGYDEIKNIFKELLKYDLTDGQCNFIDALFINESKDSDSNEEINKLTFAERKQFLTPKEGSPKKGEGNIKIITDKDIENYKKSGITEESTKDNSKTEEELQKEIKAKKKEIFKNKPISKTEEESDDVGIQDSSELLGDDNLTEEEKLLNKLKNENKGSNVSKEENKKSNKKSNKDESNTVFNFDSFIENLIDISGSSKEAASKFTDMIRDNLGEETLNKIKEIYGDSNMKDSALNRKLKGSFEKRDSENYINLKNLLSFDENSQEKTNFIEATKNCI